ncbi:MAG TPA: hypothetical protein VFR90_08245 [Methylibium sp.]|uniref:hypothetical protein n=1 Tax=Methylibium sp. TaxID=2067992 RepID=UPI002DB965FD|nr:hypothetical protein [Methylibium sp.]HEU4459095.1 hypothetical protein [Methylibium sp.]
MSMSKPDSLTPPSSTPRRADPIQPDRPGSGNEVSKEEKGPPKDDAATRKAMQRERDALDNVSKGYD